MILKGYIVILSYIFLIIFLIGPIIKKFTNIETSRKIIHILLFMVWIFLTKYMKDTIHQVIIPIIFLILNALSYKFHIYKSIERDSGNHLGTVYFAIAITGIMLISYFYPSLYYCSGISTFCLTFGDGFAALIGYNTKSKELTSHKSINGFIACFLASFLSLLIFNNIYSVNLNIISLFIISIATSIFELVGNGLDNISIVFMTFLLSYLLINYYSDILVISCILAIIIFLIVFLSKAITYYGSLLSMLMVFSYMYFGGKIGITVLLSEYFFIFFIGLIRKKLKKEKKNHGRGFLQILINGGLGTLFIILYGIYNDKKYLLISIVAVSGCFIDSVSSDIGTLTHHKVYDIFKRKEVPNGISGGMSILGTISSLLVTIILSLSLHFSLNLKFSISLICLSLIFGQTLIDSLLGSILQVKYECQKCHKLTENKTCCNELTQKYSGISWINNNMVNILSSLIISILASLIIR